MITQTARELWDNGFGSRGIKLYLSMELFLYPPQVKVILICFVEL